MQMIVQSIKKPSPYGEGLSSWFWVNNLLHTEFLNDCLSVKVQK